MAFALVAAACGGGSDESTGSGGGGGGEPVTGGTLTVLAHSDGGTSMDPATSLIHSTTSSMPMSAIYDTLVYIDPESGEVETQIAESLEPNADGSVWTLTIRPGVQFSDGTPFDAAAVHAEVQRLANPDTMAAAVEEAQAVTTRVVDELTVEFVPDQPDMNYGHVIALNFTMIPSPTAMAADPEGFGQNPVGAGPFVLADWVVGETKRFERNESYWQDGQPYLDAIETVVVSDPQQQINRMEAGDADLISNQTAEMFQMAREADLEVVTGGQLSGGFIWAFNHEVPPFDDIRARQAFQAIVDSTEMGELLFPEGGVDVPVNQFSEESPFYDESVDLSEPDPDEAQALLDEIAADGEPLSFEITTRIGPSTEAYAEYAQSAFSEYENVDVSIRVLETNDYLSQIRTGEYSVAYYTGWWSAPYPVFHQIYGTDGPLNYSNYSNPEVDELLDQARQTADPAEQSELYRQVVELMNEDAAVIPFQVAEVGFIKTDRLEGVHGVHLGNTPLWGEMHFVE